MLLLQLKFAIGVRVLFDLFQRIKPSTVYTWTNICLTNYKEFEPKLRQSVSLQFGPLVVSHGLVQSQAQKLGLPQSRPTPHNMPFINSHS